MVFERAVLKALFYNYPIEVALTKVQNWYKSPNEDMSILEILPKLIGEWLVNNNFTISDFEFFIDGIKQRWTKTMFNDCANLFKLVNEYCANIVESDNNNNINIGFDNLLRWQDLSFHLSQDLLLSVILSKKEGKNSRKNFAWNDCITTNNCDFLPKGLIDVHAHINSSYDVFSIWWIYRMNNFEPKIKKNSIRRNSSKFDTELILSFHKYDDSLNVKQLEWVEIAMILRWWVYIFVYNDVMIESKIFIDLFNRTDKIPQDILNELKSNFGFDSSVFKDISKHYKIKSEDKLYLDTIELKNNIYEEIKKQKQNSISFNSMVNNPHWDYAIVNNLIDEIYKTSPFLIHWGERKMFYDYFALLNSRSKKKKTNAEVLAPIVWLYFVIKINIRKNFIPTNGQK